MSQIVKVSGKVRSSIGSGSARRLRTEGQVPCNVYGHKQGSVSISVCGDVLSGVVKSGARVVDLDVEGKAEKALLKDVQWDTFSTHIVHVDFLRVDMDERVKIDVPLQMKGTAPGVTSGGLLEIPHHTVHVECLAVQVPDFIQVRVGALQIGDAIHVRDLQDLPESVKVLTPEDVVLVHVVEPKVAKEPEAGEGEEGVQEPALVNPPKEKEGAGKAG